MAQIRYLFLLFILFTFSADSKAGLFDDPSDNVDDALSSGSFCTPKKQRLLSPELADDVNDILHNFNENQKENLILFPGSFSPPHKMHFNILRSALAAYPKSDALVIIHAQARDSVDPSVAKEIWEKYYFPILKKNFSESHFSVQMDEDNPHNQAFRQFVDKYKHDIGRVIAGQDRQEYAKNFDEPQGWSKSLKDRLKNQNEERKKIRKSERFFMYEITPRDETSSDSISATTLRKCLRDASVDGLINQEKLKECKHFFPDELSDALFSEAANSIASQMRAKETENLPP